MPPLVMVLDDEPLIAMSLRESLENWGFEVLCAATCQEALDLVDRFEIDVALVDLMINQQPCDNVVEKLNAKRLPWALCTAVDASVLGPAFLNVPMIAKPFRYPDVRSVLHSLLPNERWR